MKQMMGLFLGIGFLLLTVLAAAWIISERANDSSTLELAFGGRVLTSDTSRSPFPVESVRVAMDYSEAQKRASKLMRIGGHDGTSMAFQGKMFKGTPFETAESHSAKFELHDDLGAPAAAVFLARIENELSACVVFCDGGTSVVQRVTFQLPPDSTPGRASVQLATNQFPHARGRSSMTSNRLAARHLTTDANAGTVCPFYVEQLSFPADLNPGSSRLTSDNTQRGFVSFPHVELSGQSATGLVRIQSNEVEVVFLLPRTAQSGTHIFAGKMN